MILFCCGGSIRSSEAAVGIVRPGGFAEENYKRIFQHTCLRLATVWLGILYLIKDEVLQFLGEPGGEFMAVVPVGYAVKSGSGPKKEPFEMKVRYLD